mmetsp:Transcript_14773/g.36147  ORF Transcript_14773/g.36147 Transcript_14773/m.36147 type:complete len:145 (+) Transcript_14773:452-886(+)
MTSPGGSGHQSNHQPAAASASSNRQRTGTAESGGQQSTNVPGPATRQPSVLQRLMSRWAEATQVGRETVMDACTIYNGHVHRANMTRTGDTTVFNLAAGCFRTYARELGITDLQGDRYLMQYVDDVIHNEKVEVTLAEVAGCNC